MLTGDQKIEVLREHSLGLNLHDTFIETGTAMGMTPLGLADLFRALYTIDIGEDCYQNALLRFLEADVHNIIPIWGDSDLWLGMLVQRMTSPTMFWLDAHYENDEREDRRGPVDTPIVMELHHILSVNKQHTILIDDARLFGTDPEYPTIDGVEGILDYYHRAGNLPSSFVVSDDIIRIIPK